jgi:hypothetical protein
VYILNVKFVECSCKNAQKSDFDAIYIYRPILSSEWCLHTAFSPTTASSSPVEHSPSSHTDSASAQRSYVMPRRCRMAFPKTFAWCKRSENADRIFLKTVITKLSSLIIIIYSSFNIRPASENKTGQYAYRIWGYSNLPST